MDGEVECACMYRHQSGCRKFKEPLINSWSSSRGSEAVKYEAQNAGNIGNISKFCNEVVDRLRGPNTDHGINQRFLKYRLG